MLLLITAFFLLIYAALILYYFYHWLHIKQFTVSSSDVTISVVVAARNEEENIGNLLEALEKQTFPASQFEIIVVDDFSTDQTVENVKKFPRVHLIQPNVSASVSSKKRAIEAGINKATGELIVITDADCLP